MLYSRLSVIYFIHISVYMSIPVSRFLKHGGSNRKRQGWESGGETETEGEGERENEREHIRTNKY